MGNYYSNIIDKYGIEWTIIELVAKGINSNQDKILFCELFCDSRLKIGKLWEMALKNKIISLLAWYIFKYDLHKKIHSIYVMQFKMMLDYTKRKNEIYLLELKDIVSAFSKSKISYVLTKGLVLADDLYNSLECRGMNDIDIIINLENANKVKVILKELGYIPGVYDMKNNNINQFSRNDQMLFNITRNKLLGYVKTTDDYFIHAVYVGVDLSLTWSDCQYNIDIIEALQRYQEKKLFNMKKEVRTFEYPMHFIYLTLHLLKHAWTESLQKSKDSCTLMQYTDVYRFWIKYHSEIRDEVKDLMNKYKIEMAMTWVWAHVDNLFQTDIINELGLRKYVTDTWLKTIISTRGKKLEFSGEIRDILADV